MTDAPKNAFTLEGFKKAADQKYGRMVIDVDESTQTVLSSPLRIDEKARDRVIELADEFKGEQVEDADSEDSESLEDLKHLAPKFREFLLAVGDENTQKLLDAVGSDLAVLLEIFQTYQDEVGLGEASASSD